MLSTIPYDCIENIFGYLDYKNKGSLYSCSLVNKYLCEVAIPFIWEDPFYSVKSTRILINCLSKESKKLLEAKNIDFTFNLLEKPTLHNYAMFAKTLFIYSFNGFNELIKGCSNDHKLKKLKLLIIELLKLIIKHSRIKSLHSTFLDNFASLNQTPRFHDCFLNLSSLYCSDKENPSFFYQLAQVSRNIQLLYIKILNPSVFDPSSSATNNDNDGLIKLIRVQNNIKNIYIKTCDFIGINGKTLQILIIKSERLEEQSVRRTLQAIGDNCYNLKTLSISYNNNLSYELSKMIERCNKLEKIALDIIYYEDEILDCNKQCEFVPNDPFFDIEQNAMEIFEIPSKKQRSRSISELIPNDPYRTIELHCEEIFEPRQRKRSNSELIPNDPLRSIEIHAPEIFDVNAKIQREEEDPFKKIEIYAEKIFQ
ncbi:11183_t:CDS:2 [Entrophospora sp. SA101]|nr:11183_t:CDS:2 [Entrophospora sp. SA101]